MISCDGCKLKCPLRTIQKRPFSVKKRWPCSLVLIACVASVPVRGHSASEELFAFGRAKCGARPKRWKEGGGGGERRERLSTNPLTLKIPVRPRTGPLISAV